MTISQNQGTDWIVTGGLNPGDKVIVDGMALVQMSGAKKVQTKPWQADAQPAAPDANPQPAVEGEQKNDSTKPAESAKP